VPQLFQLLRDFPPGYGGVERVAHSLGQYFSGTTLSFCRPQGTAAPLVDPLPVHYQRHVWPSVCLGRLRLPLATPSLLWRLFFGSDVLLLHLPCPTILLFGWFLHLLRPRRPLHLYWHAFLESPSLVYRLYEWAAFGLCRRVALVITTSPVLRQCLLAKHITSDVLFLLPPGLPLELESRLLCLPPPQASETLNVACIGRLDSYKRIDWVIDAIASVPTSRLFVIGTGPKLESLLAKTDKLGLLASGRVVFLGRLDERSKIHTISESHLLVLASDSCNEAFGIVQLEAMAAGRLAVSFDLPRSGMAWVNGFKPISSMICDGQTGLVNTLANLANDPLFLSSSSKAAQLRYVNLFSQHCWRRRCNELASRLELLTLDPTL